MLDNRFKTYIKAENLFDEKSKVLLAVSGGADSMAMLHMMKTAGFNCIVAHVNFNLRGEESDADSELVKSVCQHLDFAFYMHSEDTYAYAKLHKQSIEMAAREIRYDFFERLMVEHKCDCVAVAHHSDDIVETFFINLMRGTGINGLTGIASVHGKVVRPLLWSSHQELIQYLEDRNLDYGVDRTNFDTTILRNKLRHDIIPDFENLKPGFKQIMQRSIARLGESEAVVSAYVNEWKQKYIRQEGDVLYINKSALYSSASPSEILFKVLQPKGFSSVIIDEIIHQPDLRVGAFFECASNRLVVDREELIVASKYNKDKTYCIAEDDVKISAPISIEISHVLNNEHFRLIKQSNIACLDIALLEFPLVLRRWQHGDVFQPIGMKGRRKKVSDFFVDKKMSLVEKESVWLLCSGNNIVWIVGYRLDDRFKVSEKTAEIIRLELGEN